MQPVRPLSNSEIYNKHLGVPTLISAATTAIGVAILAATTAKIAGIALTAIGVYTLFNFAVFRALFFKAEATQNAFKDKSWSSYLTNVAQCAILPLPAFIIDIGANLMGKPS